MTAYNAEMWHDLFVMTGGAAAALAGLIFVAVSLNHEAILEIPALPALAARALSILIGLVLPCLVSLAPGQPREVLGLEVLIIGLTLATVVMATKFRNLGGADQARWRVSLVALAVLGSIPAVIAGVSLIAGIGAASTGCLRNSSPASSSPSSTAGSSSSKSAVEPQDTPSRLTATRPWRHPIPPTHQPHPRMEYPVPRVTPGKILLTVTSIYAAVGPTPATGTRATSTTPIGLRIPNCTKHKQ